MRRRIAQGAHRTRPSRSNNDGRQHWIFVGSFFVAAIACASVYMIVPLDWDKIPMHSKLPNATMEDAYDPVRQFHIKFHIKHDFQYTWGTYRPQLYFGLQSRHAKSPQFGLIWYTFPAHHFKTFRHWCEQGDDIHYMWTDHDGQSFGNQDINDNEFKFATQWYNQGRSFATSIRMVKKIDHPETRYAFMFYFHHPDPCLLPIYKDNKLVGIEGKSEGYGNFKIHFGVTDGKAQISETSYEGIFDGTHYGELFKRNLFATQGLMLTKNEELSDSTGRNLWYILFITNDLTTFQFNFTAEGEDLGNEFDTIFSQKLQNFQDLVADKFDLIVDSVSFVILSFI